MEALLELAIILIFARLVSELFVRMKLSPVLGEIMLGIFLGSAFLGLITKGEFWTVLSEISIIIMIFIVGLETNIKRLLHVGKTAAYVALFSVLVPLVAGFGIGTLFNYDWRASLFMGGILVATSIAVTARVFMDLGQVRSKLSQTILASAIIDDVVGLLILTLILAVTVESTDLMETLGREAEFLFIIIPIFWFTVPKFIIRIDRLEGEKAAFVVVLGLLFLCSFLAEWAGLATIIGAFVIGVIITRTPLSSIILEDTKPIYYFLAPIFFVFIGVNVNVSELTTSLFFVVSFSLVAILSKIVGGVLGGLFAGEGLRKGILFGVGMVPRGEVALIIALIGSKLNVIDDTIFAATAFMSFVTIVLSPLLLKHMVEKTTDGLK